MLKFDKISTDVICLSVTTVQALLHAPTGATEIYLYAQLHGTAELETLCREFDLSDEQVRDAINFLRNERLLRIARVSAGFDDEDAEQIDESPAQDAQPTVKPRRAVSLNQEIIPDASPAQSSEPDPQTRPAAQDRQAVYSDAEFNDSLQRLFSDRLLTMSDLKGIYECCDVYGLPKGVVLFAAEHAIGVHQRGNRLPIRYIQSIAREWAENDIKSVEDAQTFLTMQSGANRDVREILSKLGQRRQPTNEERKLYEKWTGEWGYSHAAVLEACALTASASSPSMKYLDGILRNLHEQEKDSVVTKSGMNEHIKRSEDDDASMKKLLAQLGAYSQSITPELRRLYRRWTAEGFDQAALEFAFGHAAIKGRGTLEYISTLLDDWGSRGLYKADDILADLSLNKKRAARIRDILRKAGVSRAPADGDYEMYDKYAAVMDSDVISFAAELAYGSNSPLRTMVNILERWQNAGVKNIEQARAQDEAHRAQNQQNTRGRRAPHSEARERDYTGGELESRVPGAVSSRRRKL